MRSPSRHAALIGPRAMRASQGTDIVDTAGIVATAGIMASAGIVASAGALAGQAAPAQRSADAAPPVST